jgi:hypothetical protein
MAIGILVISECYWNLVEKVRKWPSVGSSLEHVLCVVSTGSGRTKMVVMGAVGK